MDKTNCLICSNELVYNTSSSIYNCEFCKTQHESFTICKNGHYVCDNCHASPSREIIKRVCLNTSSTNPVKLALKLMKHPSVKMHGPEHHFLVPAVLLATYYNSVLQKEILVDKLNHAEKRSKNILGGFCGFYGACGAAIGTGIFISLVSEATPLSTDEWSFANEMTGISLQHIAKSGGPRCCKRDTFISLLEAIEFIKNKFDVSLEKEKNVTCEFSHLNKECLKEKCSFYKESNTVSSES